MKHLIFFFLLCVLLCTCGNSAKIESPETEAPVSDTNTLIAAVERNLAKMDALNTDDILPENLAQQLRHFFIDLYYFDGSVCACWACHPSSSIPYIVIVHLSAGWPNPVVLSYIPFSAASPAVFFRICRPCRGWTRESPAIPILRRHFVPPCKGLMRYHPSGVKTQKEAMFHPPHNRIIVSPHPPQLHNSITP